MSLEIDISAVSELLGYTDPKQKSTYKWLKQFGIQVYPLDNKYARRKFVLASEFYRAYEAYIKGTVPTPQEVVKKVELNESKTFKKQPQMNKVTLKEKQQMTGLFLTCSCKSKPLYAHEGAIKCNCTSFRYKIRIYVPGGGEIRKVLTAANYEDAVTEFMQKKKELEGNNYQSVVETRPVAPPTTKTVHYPSIKQRSYPGLKLHQTEERLLMLPECVNLYLDYLNNNTDRIRKKESLKSRSHENNQEAKRFLYMYMQALRDFKYKVELLPIDAIGQDAVDWVQNWLEEEQEWDFEGKIIAKVAYSNCSFNKVVQRLSCFHRWIIRELKLNIPNLWDKYGADRKPQVTDIKTVDLDDFYSMLKHVTKEKGWTIIAGYKRNVFQPWLKAAFQFGLYTGGRRAVLANVRWCDVKYDKKGNPSYLLVEKIKENKAKGFVKQTEKLTYPFILTHELLELLEELGLHNNKGKEEFIFAPEIMERKFIMQCLTRGFTHFYSLLNNGEHLTFKHLRKTFITDMELARIEGRIESVEEATGHAKNTRVLKKNYIDTRTIAAKLKGRRMVKKVA